MKINCMITKIFAHLASSLQKNLYMITNFSIALLKHIVWCSSLFITRIMSFGPQKVIAKTWGNLAKYKCLALSYIAYGYM